MHDDDKVARTFLKLQGPYWNNWQLMHEIELWGIVQESNHVELSFLSNKVFIHEKKRIKLRGIWFDGKSFCVNTQRGVVQMIISVMPL